MTVTESKFVVLRHDVGTLLQRTSQTHLDWMFAVDGRLKTFATEVIDPLASHRGINATLLDDHRLHYLEYEGEVSGGRGTVTRIAQGRCEWITHCTGTWHARLYWASDAGELVDYRMRSELWLEDIRGVLHLRLSATR